MSGLLENESNRVTSIPGYIRVRSMGPTYRKIYNDFKEQCASGRQPGTFAVYCRSHGLYPAIVHSYLSDHGLRVGELPGYHGCVLGRGWKCKEIPFENVIFYEVGIQPVSESNVITVSMPKVTCVIFIRDPFLQI